MEILGCNELNWLFWFQGEDADISVRQMIVESRRTIHKQTESETAKRWNFEQSIRRPYFHVKPLEATQLKNWLDYLNFEIEEKQANRVMFLFERCLVACALYEEFWRKVWFLLICCLLCMVRTILVGSHQSKRKVGRKLIKIQIQNIIRKS